MPSAQPGFDDRGGNGGIATRGTRRRPPRPGTALFEVADRPPGRCVVKPRRFELARDDRSDPAAPTHAAPPDLPPPNLPPLGEKLRAPAVALALGAADLLGILGLGTLVFLVHGVAREYDPDQLVAGLILLTLTWTIGAQAQGLYRAATVLAPSGQMRQVVGSWAIAFGCLLLLAFTLKLVGTFSRVWLLAWCLVSLIWLAAVRAAWSAQLRHLTAAGHHTERIVVLAGSRADAMALAAGLTSGAGSGAVVVAIFANDEEAGGLADPAFLERLSALPRAAQVDRVCIAQRGLTPAILAGILDRLYVQAVNVAVVPDLAGARLGPVRAQVVGSLALVDVATQPLSDAEAFVKRAEDLLLSALLLTLLSPLMLATALAIRLETKGPVFFRQKRVGLRGMVFDVLKFRSMGHAPAAAGLLRQTSRDDPRVTRVGRLIRRLSVDELPQLFNVLRGDMSLIGPRPHALHMTAGDQPLEAIADDYAWRHRMKPGITGWAQINGFRGEVTSEEQLIGRLQHDLYYIDQWSVWFDLQIILRTAVMILFDRRAY